MAGTVSDKVRVGDHLKIRQPTWNDVIDTKEDYTKRRQLGVPKEVRHVPLATDKIKVQNDTGSDRRLGEVATIDNVLLLDSVDQEHLWQSAIVTDPDKPFGIFRHPTPAGIIDELQVSGVCKALITINDITHTHARPSNGNHVLTSDNWGPIRLLYWPQSTGEQECIVLFGDAKEQPDTAEGYLAGDLCSTDSDEEQVANVTACVYLPNCQPFVPAKVINPYHEAGPDGALVHMHRKKCPNEEEVWIIDKVELTRVCVVVGLLNDESCLKAAALRIRASWAPCDEPIKACKVVEYLPCPGEPALPPCVDDWVFEPLYACCGQLEQGGQGASQRTEDGAQARNVVSVTRFQPGQTPGGTF